MADRNADDTASRLNKLFLRRENIRRELKKVEKEVFKYETLFLETTQGTPVTKTLDYYTSNRSERKKHHVRDTERIFSKDLPHISEH